MDIKFLTLNIWNGGILMDSAIEMIQRIDPDILVLQEVYDGHDEKLETRYKTMDVLKQSLVELPHSVFYPTVLDLAVHVPWGNAVFSKFPILAQRNIVFGGKHDEFDFITRTDFQNVQQGMVEAKIEANETQFFVYSWHGVWGTDGYDSESRAEMGEVMIREMRGKAPIILAGDTNLYPTTQFVSNLEHELSIVSVFGTSLISTFNLDHKDTEKTGYATAPVDMVFASPEFTVLHKEMPLADVSDHYPLLVEFEI